MNRISVVRLFCLLLTVSLTTALTAAGETKTLEITVSAGPVDRVQSPVCVPLSAAQSLAGAKSAMLLDAGGNQVPGQIAAPGLMAAKETAAELHFILPELKAGATTTLKATLSTEASPGEAFAWTVEGNESIELRFGIRPVIRYMCRPLDESSAAAREQTYKVYHHVFDPSGTRIVTKGPGGQYTHHRGLYFGFNKVTYGEGKVCDVWHCSKEAYQSHDGVESSDVGAVIGRHRVKVGWHGEGKELFAEELRELTVYHVPGGQLIEFASRVKPKSHTKLDGDPQHAGFHFRADNEVATKTKGQTYYLRPDGKDAPGKTRNWPGDKGHVDLPWNSMSFVLGDKRFTTGYFDKPTNPKEARFSERDYGRFGSYFAYEMTPEKPLVVNYRVWLQDGEWSGEQAAAASANFVTPVAAVVK